MGEDVSDDDDNNDSESSSQAPAPSEESLPLAIKRLCQYAYYRAPDANRLYYSELGDISPYKRELLYSGGSIWGTAHLFHEIDGIPGALRWFQTDWPRSRPQSVVVLRNLSKNVFVRSDTFSVNGRDPVWGFGRALVFRISWSTDPSCAMRYEGLTRGVWAGDRFDVVSLATFQTESDAADAVWKNVTQEVKDEMIAIVKSDYGDNWERWAW